MSSDINFIKTNPLPGSNSLLCEARGLEELRKTQKNHQLLIPKTISLNSDELVLEKIASVSPTKNHWEKLAQGLARLHEVSADQFGFESSNFIGLKPQVNNYSDNWGQFFIHYRLRYQVDLIEDISLKDKLNATLLNKKNGVVDFINSHHPKPALVHGDLWSGNIMFSKEGPWLIDPAVYYGDAEVDLAMTKLFGGFSQEFYEAYYKYRPLLTEHKKRETIYNLYHYLNHYNIFGSSYLPAVKNGFSLIEKL